MDGEEVESVAAAPLPLPVGSITIYRAYVKIP
jgi:hypothetical protein